MAPEDQHLPENNLISIEIIQYLHPGILFLIKGWPYENNKCLLNILFMLTVLAII